MSTIIELRWDTSSDQFGENSFTERVLGVCDYPAVIVSGDYSGYSAFEVFVAACSGGVVTAGREAFRAATGRRSVDSPVSISISHGDARGITMTFF